MQLFDLSWISAKDYRSTIANDLNEASICKKHHAYKAASILIGSAMEATLLYSLRRVREQISKNPRLKDLLEKARQQKIVTVNNTHFGHAIRESRNLVHPQKCIDERYEFNKEKTKLLFQAYKQIFNECKESVRSYLDIGIKAHVCIDGITKEIIKTRFRMGHDASGDFVANAKEGMLTAEIIYENERFYLVNGGNSTLSLTKDQELATGDKKQLMHNSSFLWNNKQVNFYFERK